MSRFLDQPPPEETVPLFPKHWSYDVFVIALGLEVFAFFVSGGRSHPDAPARFPFGAVLFVASAGAATIPFLFAPVRWMQRLLYAFTGALFWGLTLVPLVAIYFFFLRT